MVASHKQGMRMMISIIVSVTACVLSAGAQTIPPGVPMGPVNCYVEENGRRRSVPCPDQDGGNTLGYLEEADPGSECALNMAMFLDLPTHLRSIPTNDLEKLVGELLHTTDRMSRAQDVIYRLLDGATAK